MPIIVGAPRSGTTLLRMMLDAHPQLAIPPETGFLTAVAADTSRETLFRTLTDFPPGEPAWNDFGLSKDMLWEALRGTVDFSSADGVRAFYQLYAQRFNKSRYGDKTPSYCKHMLEIQSLLPEAAFIHIIRDGRDAAMSLRPLWFSPGQDVATLARYWKFHIEKARVDSTLCNKYLEVRYERLVTDPSGTLASICGFLDLDFDRQMLQFFENAPSRLAEHQQRVRSDGVVLATQQMRLMQQWRTTTPPDITRIGAWRGVMTTEECQQFELVAGSLLRELGYEN